MGKADRGFRIAGAQSIFESLTNYIGTLQDAAGKRYGNHATARLKTVHHCMGQSGK